MVRTRVGYTGGTKKNPTYHNLGDHTESIQIDYDPAQISYEKLLEVFWQSHDPCRPAYSRQYMTAVFYHNAAQKKLAEQTRDREAAKRGKKIVTAILPLSEFYLAEDYHQKYYLRQTRELMKEYSAIYPRAQDFMNSTAAARVNGYIDGKGTAEGLAKEIDQLGLSPEGQRRLQEIFKQASKGGR